MIHVVLYEPEIPPNAGNVIRLCANTGAMLHLVKPLGFRLDDKSLQRSGLDYHDLADVRVHAHFDACLTHLAQAQAGAAAHQTKAGAGAPAPTDTVSQTPAGAAAPGLRLFAVETGGRRCYAEVDYRAGDAFLFGPETRGLPDAVQARIGGENSLFIPMRAASRSLNLANSVAVIVYEAWRCLQFAGCAPN